LLNQTLLLSPPEIRISREDRFVSPLDEHKERRKQADLNAMTEQRIFWRCFVKKACLIVLTLGLTAGCSSTLELKNGVSRNVQGMLVIQVPSEQAATASEALNLSREAMLLNLSEGEHHLDTDDIERIRRLPARLIGEGPKSVIWVPEYQASNLVGYYENLSVREQRVYRSKFVSFWIDVGSGLWALLRFLFTGH